MILSQINVNKIFKFCLYKKNEIKNGVTPLDTIIAKGIMMNVGFNPTRLEFYKKEITDMISQLSFQNGSFLKMCDAKNGQWTGLHADMEELLCLGVAIGKIEYDLPKNVWSALPGGMPFITIK